MLVKYLFQCGEKALNIHDERACGVAISHLQDAVEMFLYAIVKERDLDAKPPKKDKHTFSSLWQAVEGSLQQRLPFASTMEELNNTRVQFKHFGIVPFPPYAEEFRVSTSQFLTEATKMVFDRDFESISLVDLIKDEQIRNALKQAEDCLKRGGISECLGECAKAHDLAERVLISIVPQVSQWMSIQVDYGESGMKNPLVSLSSYLNMLREMSVAALLDIPARDLFRYAALDTETPLVIRDVFGYGTEPGPDTAQPTEPDEKDARFALRYVTDFVLAIETHMKVRPRTGL
jgi:hypothetical protein